MEYLWSYLRLSSHTKLYSLEVVNDSHGSIFPEFITCAYCVFLLKVHLTVLMAVSMTLLDWPPQWLLRACAAVSLRNIDSLLQLKWTRGEIICFVTAEEGPIGAEMSCCQSKEPCRMWITLKIPPLVLAVSS